MIDNQYKNEKIMMINQKYNWMNQLFFGLYAQIITYILHFAAYDFIHQFRLMS